MNGLNGGAGAQMPGGLSNSMGNFPSPAGYSAELSLIHAMVDDLSRQLADNKRVLDEVVTGVGRVRNRARVQHVGNEELISGAVDELHAQDVNLDATISVLAEALEAAKFSKEENAKLAAQYASALAEMLKQFHAYKQRHVADVATWHRSYRHQLAEARAENSRLRDQVWDLQRHAASANALLRDFRRRYDEDPARWERRVRERALRQELRFWKRMAMPGLEEGDGPADGDEPAWSDDDDLIDPVEKARLRELERRTVEEQMHQQMQQQQQQQLLHQQQQRLQLQQQQYEQQVAAAAAATAVAAEAEAAEAAEAALTEAAIQIRAQAAAEARAENIKAAATADAVTVVPAEELLRATAAENDRHYLGGVGLDDDDDDDLEDDDGLLDDDDDDDDDDNHGGVNKDEAGGRPPPSVPLPAVPQAPSSAPMPPSISRMGSAAARLREAVTAPGDEGYGGTMPTPSLRPGSPGSTGSSGQ